MLLVVEWRVNDQECNYVYKMFEYRIWSFSIILQLKNITSHDQIVDSNPEEQRNWDYILEVTCENPPRVTGSFPGH